MSSYPPSKVGSILSFEGATCPRLSKPRQRQRAQTAWLPSLHPCLTSAWKARVHLLLPKAQAMANSAGKVGKCPRAYPAFLHLPYTAEITSLFHTQPQAQVTLAEARMLLVPRIALQRGMWGPEAVSVGSMCPRPCDFPILAPTAVFLSLPSLHAWVLSKAVGCPMYLGEGRLSVKQYNAPSMH